MGRTLAEKVWDEHVVRTRRGRARPALHRPPPGARGHLAAGVRRPAAGRPHGTPPRPDARHRGPQRPDPRLDKPIADPVSRTQVETLRQNAEEFGIRLHSLGDVEQGIVHVVGPQLGLTQPGHDHRLRRLAHLHARRVRRPRLRHRHQRGRARARHPDPAAGPAEDDGGHRQRRAARRCHRQGPGARPDRARRHRRRPGLRRGVPRPGHRGALDGGPDDDLQHVASSGARRPA